MTEQEIFHIPSKTLLGALDGTEFLIDRQATLSDAEAATTACHQIEAARKEVLAHELSGMYTLGPVVDFNVLTFDTQVTIASALHALENDIYDIVSAHPNYASRR